MQPFVTIRVTRVDRIEVIVMLMLSLDCASYIQRGSSPLALVGFCVFFLFFFVFFLLFCLVIHLICMHHQQKGNTPPPALAAAEGWGEGAPWPSL